MVCSLPALAYNVGPASAFPPQAQPMPASPLEVCLQAAKVGGQALLYWRDRFQVREKGPRDLVSQADLAAQEAIRDVLCKAFPGHDFLSEEDAADRRSKGQDPIPARRSDYRWIVDPLDGTTNYVHGLPGYAVSIALQRGKEIELGVVFDPLAEECFVTERGKGAKLNGKVLKTSGCERVGKALIAVSFSPHVTRDSPEIKRFTEMLLASQSVRRMGSAALNLCYVAAGRLDGYLATSVNIWDVAAGLLMVTEAGGCISALDGGSLDLERPELLAAAAKPLLGDLVETVRKAT
jgi:myo-inositol-1(or 4)-monophosphatase